MIVQLRKFCLASSSPRRHELLKRYGIEFESCSPEIDETEKEGEQVQDYVLRLAYEKAEAARPVYPHSIILAGDTTVFYDQEILGKPRDTEEAIQMLTRLSGQRHQVYSAYSILDAETGLHINELRCTEVQFKPLAPEWIVQYVETGDPMDKAGAYSFQGLGTVMIDEIQGSYNTVIGFPIENIFWNLLESGWIRYKTQESQ